MYAAVQLSGRPPLAGGVVLADGFQGPQTRVTVRYVSVEEHSDQSGLEESVEHALDPRKGQ